MTLIEPRFRGLFLSVFALFTLFGTSMTIIGATLPKIQANFHWSYLTPGIVRRSRAVERRARYLPTRHESFPVTARWRLYVLKLARAMRRDQTHEKGARRDGR